MRVTTVERPYPNLPSASTFAAELLGFAMNAVGRSNDLWSGQAVDEQVRKAIASLSCDRNKTTVGLSTF
jgi:hypothetical protein